MTKPETAGEPSMDEILASIRKIIAEEPAPKLTPSFGAGPFAHTAGPGQMPQAMQTAGRVDASREGSAPLMERIAVAVRQGAGERAHPANGVNGAADDLSSLIYNDLGDMLEDGPVTAAAPAPRRVGIEPVATPTQQRPANDKPGASGFMPSAQGRPGPFADVAPGWSPTPQRAVSPATEPAITNPMVSADLGHVVPNRGHDGPRGGDVASRLPPIATSSVALATGHTEPVKSGANPFAAPAASPVSQWPDTMKQAGERAVPVASAEPVVLAAMPAKPAPIIAPSAPAAANAAPSVPRGEPVVLAAMAPAKPAGQQVSSLASNPGARPVASAARDGAPQASEPAAAKPAQGPSGAPDQGPSSDPSSPAAGPDAAETNAAVASALGALAAGLAASSAPSSPATAQPTARVEKPSNGSAAMPKVGRMMAALATASGPGAISDASSSSLNLAAHAATGAGPLPAADAAAQQRPAPESVTAASPSHAPGEPPTAGAAEPVSEAFIALTKASPQKETLPALRRNGHELEVESPLDDTVAELLRPMLRQWLSDNMPRIVEKALRIELADSVKHEKH